MNWSDYEAVWRRQPLPRGADADVAMIRDTFETKSRKMAATLRVSDMAEAGAGVLGMIAFAFIWWKLGRAGWPIGLALLLIGWVTARFVAERIRVRRAQLGPDAPLLARLEADIAELRRRRELGLKIWRWYLGPLAVAIALVIGAFMLKAPSWAMRGYWLFLGGFAPVIGFLLWFASAGNRRALREHIEPRLLELEKLRSDLLAP